MAAQPPANQGALGASHKVLEAAQDGAGTLLAYATLLAVVSATVTAETRDDADQQHVVDSCARAWLHASALLLFCAAGLRGYLPGGKPKKPQPYLSRILLACVGLGFLYRAFHFSSNPEYHRPHSTEVTKVAVGSMFFLGILALALAVVSFVAASRIGGLVETTRATPREIYLKRRQQQHQRSLSNGGATQPASDPSHGSIVESKKMD
mmetsp:Transcript_5361/g.17613  ORF Transcript_5361/g.17613 Transcript_5361/m.17613 type:complete len:208 (-) Transcript_5361:203-826(-)